MANKIAVVYNPMSMILNGLKTGTPHKTALYNESKNVQAKSLKFVFAHPREAAETPANKKNSLFIITG